MRIASNPYARYVAPPAAPRTPEAGSREASRSVPDAAPSLADFLTAEEKQFMLGQHLDVRG